MTSRELWVKIRIKMQNHFLARKLFRVRILLFAKRGSDPAEPGFLWTQVRMTPLKQEESEELI